MKKIIKFLIVGCLLFLLLCIIIWKVKDVNKQNVNNTEDIVDDYDTHFIDKNRITQANNVDNAEIVNIKIGQMDDSIKVTSTIKNKSKEQINSFYITIELYGEKGNLIETISINSNDIIKPYEEYNHEYCYNNEGEKIKAESAKVTSFIPNYNDEQLKDLKQMEKDFDILLNSI